MMKYTIDTIYGILLPFCGTTLGAAAVFFLKKDPAGGVKKALLGFASGVMLAASIWSLLLPALEQAGSGASAVVQALAGFLCGAGLPALLDLLGARILKKTEKVEKAARPLDRTLLLSLAVTLHNFPEGMAVGVVYAGLLSGSGNIHPASAAALSLGIALQNLPEGAIISLPVAAESRSKPKGFLYGTLSGVVEPIGALLTLLLTSLATAVLPFLLSLAAGAMICVVVEELIPAANEGGSSHLATAGAVVGFALMMALDVLCG